MEEPPLLAFRIIGCSVVTVFVGVTIIIYITSGMFYTDCLVQICAEVCLLSAYSCILLITVDAAQIDKGFCLGVAIFLHFIFLSYFLFALLEVCCMARYLLDFFPKSLLSTAKSLLAVGIGLPFVITLISAIVSYAEYTSKRNCWLVISEGAMWATVVPVGIFVGLQLILLIPVLTVTDVPFFMTNEEYERAVCFLKTRWSSLIITPCAVTSWITGIMAANTNKDAYYAAFTVSSIFLGVVILTLRISTDNKVREVLTSHVLCYVTKSKNKVSMWSERAAAKKSLAVGKKVSIDDSRPNVINGDVNHVSHR